MIDWKEKFGRKAARRLSQERVGWFITVGSDLIPQPRPVWFLWDGMTILLYSKPDARKVRHIAEHPRVSFALNTDPDGDEVMVLTGTAAIDPTAPLAHKNPAYLRRYRKGIAILGMTPEKMAREYSTAIRITPETLRGW
jgi:PPOX class probable F420-dependent enzyme